MKKNIVIIFLFCIVNSYSQVKLDTLTNQKIISLVRSGISDIIVKKTILSSKYMNVDLSSDGLILLKQNKVSDTLILALFDKLTIPNNFKTSDIQNTQNNQFAENASTLNSLSNLKPGIYYLNSNNNKYSKLSGVRSSLNMGSVYTGLSFRIKWFYEFVGSSSQFIVPSPSPEFYLIVGNNISGTIFEPSKFVLINVERKKNKRVIEIKNGFFGAKSVNGPSSFSERDGMVIPKFQELNENVYKITFDKKLPSGSYYFAPSQIAKDLSLEFFEFDVK